MLSPWVQVVLAHIGLVLRNFTIIAFKLGLLTLDENSPDLVTCFFGSRLLLQDQGLPDSAAISVDDK